MGETKYILPTFIAVISYNTFFRLKNANVWQVDPKNEECTQKFRALSLIKSRHTHIFLISIMCVCN